MKNKYCPVPESEHGEDGKVKTSVGEMPCKYCEALFRQREEILGNIQILVMTGRYDESVYSNDAKFSNLQEAIQFLKGGELAVDKKA